MASRHLVLFARVLVDVEAWRAAALAGREMSGSVVTRAKAVNGPEIRSGGAALALSAAAVAVAAVALVLTWRRLFAGMDLQDESYYVLTPWRWALGDRPFVNEQTLLQLPGLLAYPFVKVFGVVRGYDVTGIVLYTRHLYLLMMIGVAVAVFLLLRRMLRWQFALLVATVFVTYIYWATPQLSYNTLAIALLTLSLTLGARVVLGGAGGRVRSSA